MTPTIKPADRSTRKIPIDVDTGPERLMGLRT